MKKEDLFKSMSDLDQNLIAETKEEGVEVTPIRVAEGKRKLGYKPVAAAVACCVLLAGAAAAVGINYSRGGINFQEPQNTNGTADYIEPGEPSVWASSYPQNAKYQYKGDYSEFKDFGGIVCLEFAEYYNTYRDLLNACDLAVVGEFVDDPWQDINPDDMDLLYPLEFNSYNCFKIEKILEREGPTSREGGAEIVINQNYAVKGGSILSHSKLTPMLKGDRWVYFLKFNATNGTYYPLNDYMGRFPEPGYFRVYDRDPNLKDSANRILPAMTNKYGLTDENDFNENIFRTLTEILCPESIPAVQCLYDTDNLEMYNVTSFEIAEFEGLVFALKEDGVLYYKELYVSGDGIVLAGLDEVINKIYLADLNGDGKREICIWSCSNADVLDGYILIWDYANQKVYAVIGETGKTEYYLAESDGELIAFNTKCTSDGSRGEVVFSEKLSLDMKDCILHLDMGGHYERCQYDTDYCARQEGECPYRENGHHSEENTTEHHGHSEYCLQDADYCAQQGGDCPYRNNHHEENTTQHHGHSEYCLQDADYCAQQEGECPYTQNGHHNEGNSTEHHGHSDYCLQDPDYCAQQEGECPYRNDHHEENTGEHHGHSEYCLQDPDYCAQQEGECPYRNDHHEENTGEHHGHSEYCLQDPDYCAQQEGECPYRQSGSNNGGNSSGHGGHHSDGHH